MERFALALLSPLLGPLETWLRPARQAPQDVQKRQIEIATQPFGFPPPCASPAQETLDLQCSLLRGK